LGLQTDSNSFIMHNSEILKNWPNKTNSLIKSGNNRNLTPQTFSEINRFSTSKNQIFSSQTHSNEMSHDQCLFDIPDFKTLTKYQPRNDFSSPQQSQTREFLSNSFEQKSKKSSQNSKDQNKSLIFECDSLLKAPIKKSHHNNNKSKTEKNLFQIKRLLAILKNWKEVCKSIPEGLQTSFKEKIRTFMHKKIFPLKYHEKKKLSEQEIEILSESNGNFKTDQEVFYPKNEMMAFDLNEEENIAFDPNQNLIWQNENNYNFDEKNFLDFDNSKEFFNNELNLPVHQADFREI